MKNFSYKFLQQLNAKKANKGFTLIELLVVIIIIGILSAIALPAFLNQANKARQSEAKQALGAINRGQQAYYLERQLFSNDVDGLALGLQTSTENYSYGSTNTAPSGVMATANLRKTAGAPVKSRAGFNGWGSYTVTFAVAQNQEAVRDYFGAAYVAAGTASQESTTEAVLCEEQNLDSTTAFTYNAADPSFGNVTVGEAVTCPTHADNAQNVGQ